MPRRFLRGLVRNGGKAEGPQESIGLLQGVEPKIRLCCARLLLARAFAAEKHRDRSGTPRPDIEAKIADYDHTLGRDAPLPADAVDRPGIGFERPIVARDDQIERSARAVTTYARP